MAGTEKLIKREDNPGWAVGNPWNCVSKSGIKRLKLKLRHLIDFQSPAPLLDPKLTIKAQTGLLPPPKMVVMGVPFSTLPL